MSLSDYERRRLRELEADLAGDDPVLARQLASGTASRLRIRWSGALVLVLAGFGLMVLGWAAGLAGLGVLGLLFMAGGFGHARYWVPGPDDDRSS
jgi:hypothetical protein